MKWGHTCQKIPPIVQILHKDVSQGVIFKAWSCLILYPKTQRKLSFEWDFYRVDLWNHRTSSLIIIDSTRFWTVSCFHHFWAYWTRVLFSIRALSDMYWFYLKAFPWWKSLFLDNKLSAFGKEENYFVLERYCLNMRNGVKHLFSSFGFSRFNLFENFQVSPFWFAANLQCLYMHK